MNLIEKFRTRVSRYGFKYVMQVILQNKIYIPLNRKIFMVAKKIWRNSPLKDFIILESHNDFDSNGGAFYDYLIKNGYNNRYRIIWLLRNKQPAHLPKNVYCFNIFKPSFKKSYYICTAKYIAYCHVPIEKVKKEQMTIYLTHGPFGLKAFKGKVILPESLDYCLIPSEYLAPLMVEEYGWRYPCKRQVILGYPMHDYFYEDTGGDLRKVTNKKYKKVLLWMPTFRKPKEFSRNDSDADLPMGIPIFSDMVSFEQLDKLLNKKNAFMIVKIHPMQDMTTVKVRDLSNIKILDSQSVKELEVDNYRLMKDVDALISDYSSVAYDFLHLDKPIGYTLDDVGNYTAGLIVDNPKELMAGHLIYNQRDFMQFVSDIVDDKDPFKEERRQLFDNIFEYHDGESSKRLAEFMGLHN